MKTLSEKQLASAMYIVEKCTPLVNLDGTPDYEAIATMIDAIHSEPDKGPGPDCGCRNCVNEYGLLGETDAK